MEAEMNRLAAAACTLGCVLAFPAGAVAKASPAPTRHASGTIVSVEWSFLTIQNGGKRMSAINALTAAANAVTAGDYPYVYGGGHLAAGTASVGIKGPGYNGHRTGYDCSGAVSAALAGAGLWQPGTPVPADNGVISQLLHEKLIAKGADTGPEQVTLWDDPGVHIFINIDGRYFGTSDGNGGGDANGGAGWLNDGAPDTHNHAFKPYHVLLSVLKRRTVYGRDLTFQVAQKNTEMLYGLQVGTPAQVSYTTSANGTMTARSVSSSSTTG
jgi:hypothetical protein